MEPQSPRFISVASHDVLCRLQAAYLQEREARLKAEGELASLRTKLSPQEPRVVKEIVTHAFRDSQWVQTSNFHYEEGDWTDLSGLLS